MAGDTLSIKGNLHMDDSNLFSHPIVNEPLSSSDVVDRPVNTSLFSDSANSTAPNAGPQPS